MLAFSKSRSRSRTAVRGLLAVVVGAVLMAWPAITIGTIVVLFAAYTLADAMTSISQMFRADQPAGDRVVLGLRALIEIVAAR
jgi:uncharacterized membrane protein HdeD (DUF308 family)